MILDPFATDDTDKHGNVICEHPCYPWLFEHVGFEKTVTLPSLVLQRNRVGDKPHLYLIFLTKQPQ